MSDLASTANMPPDGRWAISGHSRIDKLSYVSLPVANRLHFMRSLSDRTRRPLATCSWSAVQLGRLTPIPRRPHSFPERCGWCRIAVRSCGSV